MCERRRRRKKTGRHATRHAATTDDIARGKPFAVPPAGMTYHRRRWRGRPNNQRHAALDESSGPPRRRHAGTKLQTTSDRMHAATHALPASNTTTRVTQPHASKLRTVRTHVSTHEAPPASNTTDTRPNSNRPTVRTHVSTHVPPASWTRLESDGTNCERTTPPLAANDSGAVPAASSSSHDASQPRKM